jgi:iron complex outermembrane receptor protein
LALFLAASTEINPLNLIEVMLAQGSSPQRVPARGIAPGLPPCHRFESSTMANKNFLSRTALAAATLCSTLAAQAADTITITGRSEAGSALTGFGDIPLAATPVQATSYGAPRLADVGATRIGDLVKLDASTSDAYNAPGYWSILAVRGYTLDNRFNYRRDGLPINAETAIALDNKAGLDVLKGTSGIQAGSSAPGGLVNLVVKRPVAGLRSAGVAWRESGSVTTNIDIGDRVGSDAAIGWRFNAAYEHLDPQVHDAQGHRSLLAFAADWQIGPDTLIEVEVESSHQQQPSVAGFSMLGDIVPDAKTIDPRINLNRQPWNRPVVMDGDTASLRLQHRLNDDWRLRLHAMTQRLKSDDRTAFPYGVYDGNYECAQWCDRYAPDGTFMYWQYVSDNERRRSDALDLGTSGRWRTGAAEHNIEAGALFTRYEGRFQDQIFDIAGTGKIDGSLDTPPSAGYADANTNRDERSTEFYLRDAIRFDQGTSLWLGLRHTRLERESERTSPAADGLRATSYSQSVNTPWLALAQQLTPQTLVYASWGEGLESEVAPNRTRYVNAGQALPALKSRQIELGVKHASERLDAALTAFDIDRPQSADLGSCDVADSCTRAIDGSARHRGLEGQLVLRQGAWEWQLGAMLLDAERRGSSQAGVNGTRPVNVPSATLRLGAGYQVATVPGLELLGALAAESDRVVLPYDDSVRIPGWSRLDLGARWLQRIESTTVTWRAGIDNVTDRRAWKESPYQFGHAYLYPIEPRTWRVSAQVGF